MSTMSRYPTIAERYARLRARCPIPPCAEKRRLRSRPVVPQVVAPLAPEPWDIDDPQVVVEPLSRVRTPLIIDLEKRLAARAGMARSKPSGPVSLGDRSLPEDRADDVPEPAMPPGEKMA
jgi:hypothetical protein